MSGLILEKKRLHLEVERASNAKPEVAAPTGAGADEQFAVATMPTDVRSKKRSTVVSNESASVVAVLSKKELREKRMRMRLKKHPNYEAVIKAKKIWEQLRM